MSALSAALELVPVVERVHGDNHPGLTRVRELTEAISRSDASGRTADLFRELRQVTGDYAVPSDGCEGFAAAYRALQSADDEQARSAA